jgi:hypothetical protein
MRTLSSEGKKISPRGSKFIPSLKQISLLPINTAGLSGAPKLRGNKNRKGRRILR